MLTTVVIHLVTVLPGCSKAAGPVVVFTFPFSVHVYAMDVPRSTLMSVASVLVGITFWISMSFTRSRFCMTVGFMRGSTVTEGDDGFVGKASADNAIDKTVMAKEDQAATIFEFVLQMLHAIREQHAKSSPLVSRQQAPFTE